MSPKIGRPKTGNAKEVKVNTRLSDNEAQKLEYCCKSLQVTKAEVIRRGIDKVYEELKSNGN